jgi:hypothetical protein
MFSVYRTQSYSGLRQVVYIESLGFKRLIFSGEIASVQTFHVCLIYTVVIILRTTKRDQAVKFRLQSSVLLAKSSVYFLSECFIFISK